MQTDGYLNLIINEHRSKPKFRQTVKESIEPILDCMSVLQSINEKFDLDSATGDQLRIIAEWVGAPLVVPNIVPLPFFGFDGQPEALTFGETDNPDIGGVWRESGVSSYRGQSIPPKKLPNVVRAKILLNNSDCTLDEAFEICKLLTDVPFKLKDNRDMTVTFEFLAEFQPIDKELVRLLFPLPSGVELIFSDEVDG
ncbi:hypothetical protein J688_3755 [Acinetobacter baumannii 145660]|uniref:DUF2612 domain-containing protein n=1 Tax=Acinetobacter baumannii TaxID=470 RepID=UPI00044A6186|nr:DUF2612 domain-containing protein [Acinetobacter baumannii]EXF97988.1 hypothetical protein J706_3726 [Acinetobacter baumannii 1488685]EXG23113.1 hypothetical protein J719_3476 [Acinetobacter baumannii 323408]EXI23733.1 hypothetical protein J621_3960 [Acinetobacter baumannii 825610]EXQ86230.1 hypothetical protein J701_3657 [Acinetobacter baumannii 11126]EXR92830.1 hypothetical protein J688_3755 [Acinetobacter baumannii 145660]